MMTLLSKFRKKKSLQLLAAYLAGCLTVGGAFMGGKLALKNAERTAREAGNNIEKEKTELAETYKISEDEVQEVVDVLKNLEENEINILETTKDLKNAGRGTAAKWVLSWREKGKLKKKFPDIDEKQAKLLMNEFEKAAAQRESTRTNSDSQRQ